MKQKTMVRALAMLLCILLVLGLAASALAADDHAAPKDTAAAFLKLLDKDDVYYKDRGLDDDGNYRIDIHYSGENVTTHEISLFIKASGKSFTAYEWNLLEYSDDRFLDTLRTLNTLNDSYNFVTFSADTSDNTVTATTSGVLVGDAATSAKILLEAYDWLPFIVDTAWDALESGVQGTDVSAETANFVGTWYFSDITYLSGDFNGLAPGTTMTAQQLQSYEIVVAEFTGDGKLTLKSAFEDEPQKTTWTQNGTTAVIDDGDDDIPVIMLDKDTIILTAEGLKFTLVREGSPAFDKLVKTVADAA